MFIHEHQLDHKIEKYKHQLCLKSININFVPKVDVYTFQFCVPVSVLSILVPGPARHYSAVVPRGTAWHDFAPGHVVLVPSSRHDGTTRHGTTVPPCLIVSCPIVSCCARVVSCPCRAGTMAIYNEDIGSPCRSPCQQVIQGSGHPFMSIAEREVESKQRTHSHHQAGKPHA
jgi:hypothetical protein